jgi:hypothetical protein
MILAGPRAQENEAKLLSRHHAPSPQVRPARSKCLLLSRRDCRSCIVSVRSSQTLRVTRHRLTWNGSDKAQQATEPVFSVSDELVLQNFRLVLRKGLDDHALLSAVMLTFAFATTAGSIDRECLRYQSEALSSIRQRMSSPDRATSESTLGAILLLAGIEVCITFSLMPPNSTGVQPQEADLLMIQARLGMPCQVQLHMGAIQQLLNVCRTKGVYLSDGIKRAIFW